ncbi:MAG TPA: FAD binding domain-containing protein [Acetobacteraceae bacterium]|jgi:carbon-monoxide dehydrogenase medium subunit|nr:FAD binding domain-containing protein [Acetobacteraceae bacterium]
MYEFTYARPTSLADAAKALAADAEAKALAGGMTFIPVLKQRLNKPTQVLDLSGLGLAGIKAEAGKITIGAMTTHHAIETSEEIRKSLPGLAKMASWIGDIQVRNRGTMGGSIANNDPAACYPAAALALGATIRTDKRAIAADDFFQGMFTTALEPGEIITAIEFPIAEKSNYEKFRNPASRYAIVGVFVAKGPAGVRVAITGAGQNGVFRHKEMEAALAKNWSADAVAGIKTPAGGLNSDIHASAEYRAHLIGVMAKRAVAAA